MVKKYNFRMRMVAGILCIAMVSCVSPVPSLPEPAPVPAEREAEADPAPAQEQPPTESAEQVDQEPIPEESPTSDPIVEVEPEPVYVPTETEYVQTFTKVEQLIVALNSIIRNQQYDDWLPYLTQEYLESLSDPAFLADVSERPILKNRGIELDSLEDYFAYVVVPSRANLRLDDLVFLSDGEVEAIMVIGETRITLYRLVQVDGQWKIGSF